MEIPSLVEQAVQKAPPDRQRGVRLLLQRYLVATSVPDKLTEAARDAAASAVQPVMQSLRAGQIIVREGSTLTEDNLRVLEALGLYSARTAQLKGTFWILLGSFLLALLLSAPLLYARRSLAPGLSMSQLTFLVVLTLAVVAVQRLALLASGNFLFGLLVPLVVAVLISETAGLMWAVWMALAVGLLAPLAPMFVLGGTLIGSVAACLLVLTVRSRVALLLPPGTIGGLASRGHDGGAGAGRGRHDRRWHRAGSPVHAGRGGARGHHRPGAAAAGRRERVRVPDRLPAAQLQPDQPAAAAPAHRGAGHLSAQPDHQQLHLVEQAVQNVGGNALQARVGALYHDVGKMRRPHFFVENQFSGENPHDHVSPHLSYLIITSHVRDGLELLREFKMPRELAPYVAEHHGTTVLSYFYKRALEERPTSTS